MIVVMSRARTLIGRLREHFGGAWTYSRRYRVWVCGDAWHVFRGRNGDLPAYRRSDTGELLMGLDDALNPVLARWKS